jgi:hypothetical protein
LTPDKSGLCLRPANFDGRKIILNFVHGALYRSQVAHRKVGTGLEEFPNVLGIIKGGDLVFVMIQL